MARSTCNDKNEPDYNQLNQILHILESIGSLIHCDQYFPLTLQEKFFENNSNIQGLHHIANVSINDFSIIKSNPTKFGALWVARGQNLERVLENMGFTNQHAKTICGTCIHYGTGGQQIKWINFYKESNYCNKDENENTKLVQSMYHKEINVKKHSLRKNASNKSSHDYLYFKLPNLLENDNTCNRDPKSTSSSSSSSSSPSACSSNQNKRKHDSEEKEVSSFSKHGKNFQFISSNDVSKFFMVIKTRRQQQVKNKFWNLLKLNFRSTHKNKKLSINSVLIK